MSTFKDALDALADKVERELLWMKMERAVQLLSLPPADAQVEVKDVTDVATFGDAFALEIKGTDDETGGVEGYLAVFNNVDLVKDVIEPGAFKKTLDEARAFARAHKTTALWPLLWQHQKDEPIGCVFAADEDKKGLFVKCRLNLNIERGRQAFDGLKNGYMSFSIGYRPVAKAWKGNVRYLKEIALGEGSAVTFPANPEARATSVKER